MIILSIFLTHTTGFGKARRHRRSLHYAALAHQHQDTPEHQQWCRIHQGTRTSSTRDTRTFNTLTRTFTRDTRTFTRDTRTFTRDTFTTHTGASTRNIRSSTRTTKTSTRFTKSSTIYANTEPSTTYNSSFFTAT